MQDTFYRYRRGGEKGKEIKGTTTTESPEDIVRKEV